MMNGHNESNKIKYILHPLNKSTSKSAARFDKSPRFSPEKSFSPNKFYNLPSSFTKSTGFSMGKGGRTNFQKKDNIEPTRYRITSEFDAKKSQKTLFPSFGISRQSYYKGKQVKNPLGPGAYDIQSSLGKSNFYIGQKLNQNNETKNNLPHYDVHPESMNKLSTYKNTSQNVRMKTEYYPKTSLHFYDNKVPGPGSYYRDEMQVRHKRNLTSTTFGGQERLKTIKPTNVGPGSYHMFSEFGQYDG